MVKREKTTCSLINSTIYQELFSMAIICKFQMIHCIKKYVCKQIIQDWNNLLLFYMLCFFFGSSAQLHLIQTSVCWICFILYLVQCLDVVSSTQLCHILHRFRLQYCCNLLIDYKTSYSFQHAGSSYTVITIDAISEKMS